MDQRRTSVAERNRFVDLKLAGHTLEEVAKETRWTFDCVRYWWRCYRDGGRKALDPPDGRKQRGGVMSSFPGIMRFVFLRIKKEHPGWGAQVARPRVAERLNLPEEDMPSVSTIEKYWAQYKGRLYKRQRQRHPFKERAKGREPKAPHERWQADIKVKIPVPGLGRIDVFNIRDDFSPVKIGSFVYPYNEWDDRQVQDALRQAFALWGLCDRLQTDKEKRLVNTGAHPFPSRFTLWLASLGVEHEFAHCAQENGCAERFHRPWHGRVVEGRSFVDHAHLRQVSDEELEWINARLPSRGRACNGCPPLEAYPEARRPRRPYTPEQELQIFSMETVYRYLAERHWWRRVSKVGQISIGSHRYSAGMAYAYQDVKVTFDAGAGKFVVEDSQGKEIKRLQPQGLTVEEITGLRLEPG